PWRRRRRDEREALRIRGEPSLHLGDAVEHAVVIGTQPNDRERRGDWHVDEVPRFGAGFLLVDFVRPGRRGRHGGFDAGVVGAEDDGELLPRGLIEVPRRNSSDDAMALASPRGGTLCGEHHREEQDGDSQTRRNHRYTPRVNRFVASTALAVCCSVVLAAA